ncbi:MAG: trypsin-like peptidase domain-containing protein [Planctomycetales bacterium]|nr:trypsin-like peptidase domain-containing protein [Planctomycetales bacterium]
MDIDYNKPASPNQAQRSLVAVWLLMLTLLLVLFFPWVKSWLGLGLPNGEPRPVTPRGSLADFEQTTVDLFRETSPSVVFISTRARYADRYMRRVQEVEAGTGSGFVWDADGHVVTNFHVIEGASSAQVLFADQTSFEARLVGASPDHDLAVLQINAPKEYLRPLAIGESNDLLVGQSVFAIGNPFGLQQTLTTGVVSAKSRVIESPSGRTIDEVIQIDAAINPGNSGGPLLDSAGRLIGVNTAIYSPSGASAGVGFSIPVDTVNRVVPSIIETGKYQAPQLGIHVIDELSRAISRSAGVEGVVVLDVMANSAAERAGLRKSRILDRGNVSLGDIIRKIGKETVRSTEDIQRALQNYSPGDTVDIVVYRDAKEVTLQVRLD